MDKKMKIMIIGTVVMIIIIISMIGLSIKKKLTPSNEVMLLTDYYHVDDENVMIILQDEIYEKEGVFFDGKIYIDYNTVVDLFNHRFYYDNNEKMLILTTPTQIIRTKIDNSEYQIIGQDSKDEGIDVPIAKMISDELYILLDFVSENSDMAVRFYNEPNRVIIDYKWGEYLYTKVTKDTKLRFKPSIKSPILASLQTGTQLLHIDLDEPPKNGFYKVMTGEGIIGYIRDKYIMESYYEKIESSFNKPEYVSQTRPYKINMVFHQVFRSDTVDSLNSLISATKGVNVISPTWFSIIDNSGAISSLASHEYVESAHEVGLEVWALIDDFNTEIDIKEILSHTSSRQRLLDVIMDAVNEYELDGINIDFEYILSETGRHYIQFIRELSVMCRNKGIVLSVDNFVPPYKKHYDRLEQGKIVDYFIVMAYDEYYAGSEVAGPNSSIGFVKDAVRNTLSVVPKEKTIIAIPFYTRLWKETPEGYVSREKDFAMTPAESHLEEMGVSPKWDDNYGCYYGEYEIDGATYKMWQEEIESIGEKMKVISKADVAGIAAWKLGLEKESVWDIINNYLGN